MSDKEKYLPYEFYKCLGVLFVIGFFILSYSRIEASKGDYDDKAFRLCVNGIEEDSLDYSLERACLIKYGVEIEEVKWLKKKKFGNKLKNYNTELK